MFLINSLFLSLIILASVFLLVGIIITIISFVKQRAITNMLVKSEDVLKKYFDINESDSKHDEKNSLCRTTEYGFDFKYEDKNQIFYIKCVKNFNNFEILINSADKWQIRESPLDNSINMIEEVVDPINIDISSDKEVVKMFLIYPNAKQLMMAINECEYGFIYPETNVHRYHVVTYQMLNSLNFHKN